MYVSNNHTYLIHLNGNFSVWYGDDNTYSESFLWNIIKR